MESSSKPAASETQPQKGAEIRYPGIGMMVLIWTAIGALTSVRYHLQLSSRPIVEELSSLFACIACFYPWIPLTPIVFRIEAKFPLGSGQWVRNLAVLAAFSLPVSLLASPLMLGSYTSVMSALRVPLRRPPGGYSWFFEFPVAEGIFWCSVAGGYFVRTVYQLREQERRSAKLALEKAQLEAGLKQAQLEVLRARLNPHFLFNSLQNISVMTKQDPQTASRMLTRLGDLLRAVLRQDSQAENTLREEIELTQAYVALEQMRFGDRLHVDFAIAGEVQQAMVPCFLLQPLIENAVIHGLQGARKSGTIKVSAVSRGSALVLSVTDNGVGLQTQNPAEMKIGVGLQSTCERLAKMYPESHRFSIGNPAEGGAEVRITIPLRFAEEEDRSPHDEQSTVVDR